DVGRVIQTVHADAADAIDGVAGVARREDENVVAAAVARDKHSSVELPAESVAVVFDYAGGRVVLTEVEGVEAIIRIGLCADGVLVDLVAVHAAGGVAAIENVLAAGEVG